MRMQIGVDMGGGDDCTAISAVIAGRVVVLGELPPGCQLVGMAVFRGELVVATDQGIFVSRNGVLERLLPLFGK